MIVRIKASRPVYRRLGVVFGRQYQDFDGNRFTEDELERLQGDPVLTVTVVDGEAGQPGGDGPPQAGGSASAEPPAAPIAQAVKAPAKTRMTKAKPVATKGKGTAKTAGKPAEPASKDQQPGGDGANSSANSAEGEGAEGGKE